MNQPDELGHHPDAPIPPAVLAFSGDHVPRMELPSRSFGCWTPMGKDDIPIPFVFCYQHPNYPVFFGDYKNKAIFGEPEESLMLPYTQVRNMKQLMEILKEEPKAKPKAKLVSCAPFFIVREGWEYDTLFAVMTYTPVQSVKIDGIRVVSNPRSWGCWTPKLPGGQDIAHVVCFNKNHQAFEYPVGVICDGLTPFVRVSGQAHFKRLRPDTPLPDVAVFSNVEVHEDGSDHWQAWIKTHNDAESGAKYYTIHVRKELRSMTLPQIHHARGKGGRPRRKL